MTLQHTRRIVKSLFILFIIVVCIYLLPRVAINAFYYPDNKVYGPTPAEAESITFTAKDGTHLHGWFIPTAFGRPENAVATVIHVHGNAGNMSAHRRRPLRRLRKYALRRPGGHTCDYP